MKVVFSANLWMWIDGFSSWHLSQTLYISYPIEIHAYIYLPMLPCLPMCMSLIVFMHVNFYLNDQMQVIAWFKCLNLCILLDFEISS